MNVGCAVPSMTTKQLNDIPLVIADDEVFVQFNKLISNLYIKIETNLNEINNLGLLRDAILPRLMSGELKINEMNN